VALATPGYAPAAKAS